MGSYTRTAGFLSFYEICQIKFRSDWKAEWLPNSKAYYMYNKDDWVSYDDVKSFQMKAAYGQFCGKGKFPLIKNR